MSTVLTQGIVLRQESHKDFDRQYIIYTRDLGKVMAVAKGGQKIVSKLSPHLGGFFISDLMLAQGVAFYRIAASQIAQNFSALSMDLEKIVLANYIWELIDKAVKFDYTDTVLFEILADFLDGLSSAASREKSLLAFNATVFNILSHLGYCPIIRTIKSQRQLFGALNNLAIQVVEMDLRSKNLVGKLFT